MKQDLTRAYRRLLGLYPADQRLLFEVEMITTFGAAAEEHCAKGRAAIARFVFFEMIGLIHGIVVEWNIKLATDAYRAADLVRASSLPAALMATLIHALYRSDSRFNNRGCDPRMMRPGWIAWNDWYGDGLSLDDSPLVK